MTTSPDPTGDILPPPPGFVPLPDSLASGFNVASGGFLVAQEAGALIGGFRVTAACCNRAGFCHGGRLATVCDIFLALAVVFREDLRDDFLPTVSLTMDFMAPVARGVWAELQADTLRITRSLVFAQGLVTVDGIPAARASAVYHRTPPARDSANSMGAILRALL
ncbi:PaaI family thioesterase [Gluconacetobacter asukensis]|uniref:PaaI family thioesterase n=1 Tax=Gluconacetobacter asukensis TaxID=1017181 RepID=A0A7W4NZ67_9PROT|nr:PaaI family thioesterase [Gluconacetobacter asukensis]MBB2171314.1 PaaI family thioesterase [Gluconacetobacter asukensis]